MYGRQLFMTFSFHVFSFCFLLWSPLRLIVVIIYSRLIFMYVHARAVHAIECCNQASDIALKTDRDNTMTCDMCMSAPWACGLFLSAAVGFPS
jgi:hypothetical protein